MQTKNAMGNLKNRYLAVLRKCRFLNIMGSLALASTCVLAPQVGLGAEISDPNNVSGTYDTIQWDQSKGDTAYVQSNNTLTLTGSGDLVTYSSGDQAKLAIQGENTKLTLENATGGNINWLEFNNEANAMEVISGDYTIDTFNIQSGGSSLIIHLDESSLQINNMDRFGGRIDSLVGTGSFSYTGDDEFYFDSFGEQAKDISITANHLDVNFIKEGANVALNTNELEIDTISKGANVDITVNDELTIANGASLAGNSRVNITSSTESYVNELSLYDSASFTASRLETYNVFSYATDNGTSIFKVDTLDAGSGGIFIGRKDSATDVEGFATADINGFFTYSDSSYVSGLPSIEVKEDGMLVLGSVDDSLTKVENNKAVLVLGKTTNLFDSSGGISLERALSLQNGVSVGSAEYSAYETLTLGENAVFVADVTDVVVKSVQEDGTIGNETAGEGELQSLMIGATNVELSKEAEIKIFDADGFTDQTAYTLAADITNFTQDGEEITDIEGNFTAIEQNSSNYLTEVDLKLNGSNLEALITRNEVISVFPKLPSFFVPVLEKYQGTNSFLDLVLDPTKTSSAEEAAQVLVLTMSAEGGGMAMPFAFHALGLAEDSLLSRFTMQGDSTDSVVTSAAFENEEVVSMASGSENNGLSKGFGAWFMPSYQHSQTQGFKSAGIKYGYDSDMYGVSAGADYTFQNNFRVGGALHLGSGDAETSFTQNDMDYVGASVYAGYRFNNITLSTDFTYMNTNNDVKQKSVLGTVSSDFDSDSFSIGMNVEYLANLYGFDVTPYLGLRYSYTEVESYDSTFMGNAVFHNSKMDSSIFSIPVGVTASKEFETESGVKVSPRLTVGVNFAMGDLDAQQKVYAYGSASPATFDSELYDPVTFQTSLGLEIEKGNFGFTLDYALDASSHVTSHNVHALFRYNF